MQLFFDSKNEPIVKIQKVLVYLTHLWRKWMKMLHFDTRLNRCRFFQFVKWSWFECTNFFGLLWKNRNVRLWMNDIPISIGMEFHLRGYDAWPTQFPADCWAVEHPNCQYTAKSNIIKRWIVSIWANFHLKSINRLKISSYWRQMLHICLAPK